MTREAIGYFKFHRKIFCEDYLKMCPKDSIAYQATLKEKEFYDMAIKALETLEEFEKAQIITDGRLNGRTYAYKCGLEDGKRKALEQEPKSEWEQDHAILKAYSDGANEVLDKIRAEIEQDAFEDVKGSKFIFVNRVNQIIDKYKAEIEPQESEEELEH